MHFGIVLNFIIFIIRNENICILLVIHYAALVSLLIKILDANAEYKVYNFKLSIPTNTKIIKTFRYDILN